MLQCKQTVAILKKVLSLLPIGSLSFGGKDEYVTCPECEGTGKFANGIAYDYCDGEKARLKSQSTMKCFPKVTMKKYRKLSQKESAPNQGTLSFCVILLPGSRLSGSLLNILRELI